MMTPADIAALIATLEWSHPIEIDTRRGPRLLSKAKPTPAFVEAWAADEPALRRAGLTYGYSRYIKGYEIAHWQEIAPAEIAARAQAVTASRAIDAEIDTPRPAGLEYRPFQRGAIAYAQRQPYGHVLFADEMGLGKTVEAIGLINADRSLQKIVIICPKTLRLNWYQELTKWLVRPALIALVGDVWPAGAEIVIINYDIVKKYHAQLVAFGADALILDEAHLIRNSTAQRSVYILGRPASEKKVKGKVEHRPAIEAIPARRHIRLSGTPAVNRPAELYNVIAALHPRWTQMGFFAFAKRYAAAHPKKIGNKTFWDFSGASNLDELQRLLRETCMVRRLKADVLAELPAKVRQVIELEPETAEQRAAVAAEIARRAADDKAIADLRGAAETAQAAGDTAAYRAAVKALAEAESAAFTEQSRLRHETAITKAPLAIAHILGLTEDEPERKVIVAAHHHDVIDLLMVAFEGAGLSPVKITGAESEAERHQAVRRFQSDPACRIFVASIQAAGVGITLTAASIVCFVEESWVPGDLSQMEDRAHRIGQTDSVLVQHLVMAESPDVTMIKTTVEKQETLDRALDQRPTVFEEAYEANEKDAAEAYAALQADRAAKAAAGDAQPAADQAPEWRAPGWQSRPAADQAPAAAEPALTPAQVTAIHQGLRILAGLDDDGARELNNRGFNKTHTAFGRSLAQAARLTPKQAAAGLRLIRFYRRQLSDELVAAALGNKETTR